MADNSYTVIESGNSNITKIEDLVVGHYRLDVVFRYGTYNEIFGNSTPAFSGNVDKVGAIVKAVTAIAGAKAGPYDPIIGGNSGLEKFEDAATGDIYKAAYFPWKLGSNVLHKRVYGTYRKLASPTNPYIWTPKGANEPLSFTADYMYGVISNVVVTNPIAISINDVSVVEGVARTATFTVTLSDAPGVGETVTVNYVPNNGSAINNSDYRTASGSLIFKAGETTKNIVVAIINNNEIEPDENFKVKLSESSSIANIIDAEGVGTISDTLSSSTSAVLTSAVENLTLTGNAPINGTGSSRDNILTGNANNNTLKGQDGKDTILGQGGNDTLIGMAGNDILTGGTGSDSFVYAGKFSDIGKDTITDFTSLDKIVLSKNVFYTLASQPGNGFSNGSEFAVVDTIAEVANSIAKIVFSQADRTLYYNANGNGSGLGIGKAFVELIGVNTLSAGNFVLGEL